MSNVTKGLCWAASLIALALANRFGLVADAAANVLFIVLPVVAIMAMRGQISCPLWRGKAA